MYYIIIDEIEMNVIFIGAEEHLIDEAINDYIDENGTDLSEICAYKVSGEIELKRAFKVVDKGE